MKSTQGTTVSCVIHSASCTLLLIAMLRRWWEAGSEASLYLRQLLPSLVGLLPSVLRGRGASPLLLPHLPPSSPLWSPRSRSLGLSRSPLMSLSLSPPPPPDRDENRSLRGAGAASGLLLDSVGLLEEQMRGRRLE